MMRLPATRTRGASAARSWLRFFATAGVAAAMTGPVWAQSAPDMAQWRCRLCPFERGAAVETTTGASYVSEDAARFADGNGYDRKGGYLLLDGAGRYADERQRVVWHLEDLGLDARHVHLDGNRAGGLTYRLDYRELPHYLFDTTATVFRQGPDGALTLPSLWVRAPVTSQMTALESSLLPKTVSSQRDTLDVGVELRPRASLEVYTSYRRDERTGIGIRGASFFTTASQLPAPIDEYSEEVGAGVKYSLARGNLDLGYRASFFDNRLAALSWDNPFAGAPGTELGRMAEAPDNRYQTVSIGGGFRLLERTALVFSTGVGRGEQNEALLPYTSNAQLATQVLPRARVDGVVDTTHLAVTVTSRPWNRLRLKAAYRYDKRDNRTPTALWNRVVADTVGSVEERSNLAYDFERGKLNMAADLDLSSRLRLSAGYERTERNRNLQEVAGQTEAGGWGRLRWRFKPGLELTARRGTARRDIDRYDTSLAAELLQNPLLAKYNLAYRFRTYADVAFTATGTEHPFTFSLSALYANDDYAHSRLGLTDDKDRRIGADFGWTFSPHVALYASASAEIIDARLVGSESFGDADWRAENEDRFRTLTAGVRLEQIPPRFDLTIDASRSRGATAVGLLSASGGDFPELRSDLDALRIEAIYHRSTRIDVLLGLRYEGFDAEDWALEGVGPATIPHVLAMNAAPYHYGPFVLSAGVTYRWGPRAGVDRAGATDGR
jgi:MtrB/PioB family decaheme-associated outer membrane protein